MSVIAMGNAIGTGPDGGVSHHILHSDNTVRLVWGNDRELMTYDDAGGAYWGTLASAVGSTITTTADTKSAGDAKAGGWGGGSVIVLNGTGAGQVRRIVEPGIGPEPSNPMNRTWGLDAPFDVPPVGPDTFVQIMPYRGQNIFSGDVWEDGGAFQFYGHALDNIVADCTGERMSAFLAWGQWRGWTPAPLRGEGEEDGEQQPPRPPSRLGGEMGNGMQPNARNQYMRNTFVGTLSCPNYNYSVGYDPTYARRFFASQPIDNAPQGQTLNTLLVLRGNAGGGGVNLAVGAGDIVVEGGQFWQDAQGAEGGPCVLAPESPEGGGGVFVRGVGCAGAA